VRTWPAVVASGFLGHRSPEGEGGSRTDVGAGFSRADDDKRDLVQAALTDYDVSALDEPSPDSLRAFFHDSAERDRALAALRSAFSDLEVTAVNVPDEDWAARSQANLTSIHVGDIVVSPPWDVPARTPGVATATNNLVPIPGVLVVIQPSMGFGTGHHATTRLCLAALQRAHVRGRSVIDVGTGSGVLAIAASLLGATPVIGLDDDPDAIQSAQESLELNPEARVDLRIADLRSTVPGIADVVVANLTGTLLIQAAPQLQTLVAPRGRLIVSGLLDHEEAGVVSAFEALTVLDRSQEDEWVCLVMASRQVFE
jgi:ribosomal protein L11 methyltransferase